MYIWYRNQKIPEWPNKGHISENESIIKRFRPRPLLARNNISTREWLKWVSSSHQGTNILRFAPSFSRKVFYCFGVSHKFRTHSERKIRPRLVANYCEKNLISTLLPPANILELFDVSYFKGQISCDGKSITWVYFLIIL